MVVEFVSLTSENYDQIVKERGQNQPGIGELLHHEQIRTSETLLHRIAAVTPNGRLVGFGLAVSGPWDPRQQTGHFLLEIRIDSQWKKQGIGKHDL